LIAPFYHAGDPFERDEQYYTQLLNNTRRSPGQANLQSSNNSNYNQKKFAESVVVNHQFASQEVNQRNNEQYGSINYSRAQDNLVGSNHRVESVAVVAKQQQDLTPTFE
jgi:hypothetical protein